MQIDRTEGDHKREEIIGCVLGALAQALECSRRLPPLLRDPRRADSDWSWGVVKDNRAAGSET
jgi:hypothetical protein